MSKKHKPFVHCHVHTDCSMLDGLGGIEDKLGNRGYVTQAVKFGMPALAITDHGNALGWPTFYKECRRQGVEPILGVEFYWVEDVNWRPPKGERAPVERNHTILLARGFKGYKVLTKLLTLSHQNYYYKPLIDRAAIEAIGKDTKHLVALSGCAGSRVSELVRGERMDEAAEEVMWWRETFEHYYIELQHHDTAFDEHLTEGLISLAKRYKVPMVCTNDPHYVVEEDAPHHDALLAIQVAKNIDDPNRFRFDGHGYHLRSYDEMRRVFSRYGDKVWKECAANTLRIADLCHTRIPQWEQREWQIPVYPKLPEGVDSFTHLKKLVKRELRARGLDKNPTYTNQAKSELKVIKSTGIADFLLITMDCIEFAKSVGIPVGPGRGSVCGCLVAYLIGIHKIDPIRYTLLFERFLNPARPSLPDIDTDFGKARRGEMFKYVEDTYGIENVVHVCTYGHMQLKKAFGSLASAYGIPFNERQRLAKKIYQDEEDPTQFALPDEVEQQYPRLRDQLVRLAGTKCQVSAHPAGVIIAAPNVKLREQVPQMWIPSSSRMIGMYDLYAAEATGLMKQDFLGLRALDTVAEAVRLVEARTGEILDPDSWVPDEMPGDRKVYKMCRKGETEGVFQFEGFTNRRGCKAVQPKGFEDLVSITALYRTGPIKAKYPEKFIASRSAGKVTVSHPALMPILGNTWGVILYQEQVMDIAHQLAGFDMAAVDDIKEAIKHKDGPGLLAMESAFKDGCRDTGIIPKSTTDELWAAIREYSGYNYNRSHAVAYTMLSYQTARLKCHWPSEFLAGLISTVPNIKDNKEKRESYLQVALREGYKILPPDINLSGPTMEPTDDRRSLRFGLSDLKGIKTAAWRLVDGRPSGGYKDTLEVAKVANNEGVMKVLITSGALESIGGPAIDYNATEELLGWQLRDKMRKYRQQYADALMAPEDADDPDDVCIIGEVLSKQEGQTKGGVPYQTWQVRMSPTQTYGVRLWSETEPRWTIPIGSVVMFRGRWDARWENLGVASPKMIKTVKRNHAASV